MTCVSCGRQIWVITGQCSLCGHPADPVDFRTQLEAWAKAIAPTPPPTPAAKKAPAKKAPAKKAAKAARAVKAVAKDDEE